MKDPVNIQRGRKHPISEYAKHPVSELLYVLMHCSVAGLHFLIAHHNTSTKLSCGVLLWYTCKE